MSKCNGTHKWNRSEDMKTITSAGIRKIITCNNCFATFTSTAMRHFKFRCFVGPVIVKETVARLVADGIQDAHAGTEHVYGSIQAENLLDAFEKLNRAARFKMSNISNTWQVKC